MGSGRDYFLEIFNLQSMFVEQLMKFRQKPAVTRDVKSEPLPGLCNREMYVNDFCFVNN